MLPVGEPVAVAAKRTYTVVAVTIPPEGVIETLPPLPEYPEPKLFDTSKLAGAVITKSAVKLAAVTENDCAMEAIPEQPVNAAREPVGIILGCEAN